MLGDKGEASLPFPWTLPYKCDSEWRAQNILVTICRAETPPGHHDAQSPEHHHHRYLNTLAQTLDPSHLLAVLSHTQVLEPKSIEDNRPVTWLYSEEIKIIC